MWLCFLLQTSLVIDCLLARKLIWQQKLVRVFAFYRLCTFTATLNSLREQEVWLLNREQSEVLKESLRETAKEHQRKKQYGEFAFTNGLYTNESVVFNGGGPACLSWIGPLCESVGAEYCLSKQLAVDLDGRLSWRDLFHPEIWLSSSNDSYQTMCCEQARGLLVH